MSLGRNKLKVTPYVYEILWDLFSSDIIWAGFLSVAEQGVIQWKKMLQM